MWSIWQKKFHKIIDKYKDLENKGLLWEIIKTEIRQFTITFSKTKAKNAETKKNSIIKKLKGCKI